MFVPFSQVSFPSIFCFHYFIKHCNHSRGLIFFSSLRDYMFPISLSRFLSLNWQCILVFFFFVQAYVLFSLSFPIFLSFIHSFIHSLYKAILVIFDFFFLARLNMFVTFSPFPSSFYFHYFNKRGMILVSFDFFFLGTLKIMNMPLSPFLSFFFRSFFIKHVIILVNFDFFFSLSPCVHSFEVSLSP